MCAMYCCCTVSVVVVVDVDVVVALALVLLKLPAGYKAVLGVNENAIEKLRQSNRAMKQSNSCTLSLSRLGCQRSRGWGGQGGWLSGLTGKGEIGSFQFGN